MLDVQELRTHVKGLQTASSDEEVIDLLNLLKSEAKVTEALLRESKAGLAVGKLRSHTSKTIADLAKEVVKKWKVEVEKQKAAAGANDAARTASSNRSSVSGGDSTPAPSTATRTAKSDGVKVNQLNDKTRDKCIELLYDALACDSTAANDLILSRAQAIESEVAKDIGTANAQYKNKMRSLFLNLKDRGNPGLRQRVLSGELSAVSVATMSASDMASKERKEADAKIKAENLHNSLGAGEQQAETDAFQCGRCKQKKTRYRQAQTRSADEPMTTFVTCTNCGHRWKFS